MWDQRVTVVHWEAVLGAAIAAQDDLSNVQVQAAVAAALAAYPVPQAEDIETIVTEAVVDAVSDAGLTPSALWQYNGPGGRTLSQSMIAQLSSMLTGSAITITRGDTISVSITGLGSLGDRTGLWFTVKAKPASETDDQALIQITEDDGLVRLNEAAAGNSADGSLTVDDEVDGDITIALSKAASALLKTGLAWRWDVQVAQPGPGVWTPRAGVFTVAEDVTRTVGADLLSALIVRASWNDIRYHSGVGSGSSVGPGSGVQVTDAQSFQKVGAGCSGGPTVKN